MTILVVAEHDNSTLGEVTARMIGAAFSLGDDVHVLVAGKRCGVVAETAATLTGVTKVLLADAAVYEHFLAEPIAQLVVAISANYDTIIAPSTSFGKNFLPRVAAALDVMQISDVIEIVNSTTFRRPIYAGNAIETVESLDSKRVLTVRPTSFMPVGMDASADIEPLQVSGHVSSSIFVGLSAAASDRPDLANAKIVVSGGRGLGSKEQFEALLYPLAKKLNAAVGASRAAVDAGYVSNDCQVGQTGKVVAPDLYIACGISGAVQHLAGMRDSGVIVAINKDEDAPIFQIADFALVGDIFEVLPQLTARL